MAAGAAAVRVLREEDVHARLEALGARLEAVVAPAAAAAGAAFVREGSIFWLAMSAETPRRVEDVNAEGMTRYGVLQSAALARGVYLAPSGWEVGFLNAAMSEEDVAGLGVVLAELIGSGT